MPEAKKIQQCVDREGNIFDLFTDGEKFYRNNPNYKPESETEETTEEAPEEATEEEEVAEEEFKPNPEEFVEVEIGEDGEVTLKNPPEEEETPSEEEKEVCSHCGK